MEVIFSYDESNYPSLQIHSEIDERWVTDTDSWNKYMFSGKVIWFLMECEYV